LASDADLVESTRRGDRRAFAELYDRYAPLVRAISADATRDLTAAQDLAQEAFLRAFQRLGELRDAERFGAWLVGIARLAGKEWLRKRSRERARYVDEVGEAIDSRDKPQDERLTSLLDLLTGLPELERLALHAFYLEGQSAEAAATALGVSRSGIYKLLDKARCRLALRYRQTQEGS
jgi:RNA polymerase sigma factor (sigma-70 family)